MKPISIVAASCLMATLAPAAMAQDVFDFATQTPGTVLPTNQTLTADNNPAQTAFISIYATNANNAFEFVDNGPSSNPNYGPNLYPTAPLMSDTVLLNSDADPNTFFTLTFAHPITDLTLQFAILTADNLQPGDPNPDNKLVLSGGSTDMNGGTYNGNTFTFTGSLETSSSSPFSTVTLAFSGVNDLGYAIGDIVTSPAASSNVPEPGIVALALAGLIPAAGFLRRRRAR